MSESSILKSSQMPGWLGISCLLLVGGFASWKMLHLPLWGWWPLVMLLAFYLALILFFLPKDPTEKKWLGASLASGVLLGLGFPPSPLTFAVIFAWIPLLAVENGIYQSRDKIRPGKVFKYSYHAFALWNVIATFWVANTAFVAGIVANFVNAALMATVMVIIHVIGRKLPKVFFPFVFISAWISFEYLHHEWELSWPWLSLGNSMAEYPWAIQWYEYTGMFGGSLWILLLNWFGYQMIQHWLRARPLNIWQYASLLLIPVAVSLVIWFTVKEGDAEPVKIEIVQPNFEPHYEKFDIPEFQQSKRFLELSLQHLDSSVEYIVFPETSFEGVRLNDFRQDREVRLFQQLIDSFPGLRLVTGISSYRVFEKGQFPDAEQREHIDANGNIIYWDIQNSAIQLTSGDTAYQIYFKSKLVPGPETFPYRNVLFFMRPIVDKLEGSFEGHTKQKERSVFTGGSLVIAPIICYESVYGAYVGEYVEKGATALFIVTNDGWWDKTPGHVQHLKIGALRAIEHRRPIARSANTGISAFIDIKGRIHSPTKYRETISIVGSIKPETRRTCYSHWGDVIPKVLIIVLGCCVLGWIYSMISRKDTKLKIVP